MQRVYDGYERRKQRTGRIDFEDMLGLAVRMFDERPATAAAIRERFHAFTVDEYQDVNPLQQALLERWLGGRDQICVVGDDHQTIYTFTGASPEHLLSFPRRYPGATVVRLEENYRSTPQVLTVANRVGGASRRLPQGAARHARRRAAPTGVRRGAAEVDFVVAEIGHLHAEGTPLEEIAVLYRINARSEPYEEALAAAGIAYQVRDGAFLRRPDPRSVLARLRRAEPGLPVAEAVRRTTDAVGYDPLDRARRRRGGHATGGPRPAPRARRRVPAAARPDGDHAGFIAELARRFAAERSGRGVNLLTYHRAKGLEFEAVFLPRLLDKELPFRSGRASRRSAEERRLLYVGITTRPPAPVPVVALRCPDAAEPVPDGSGEARPPADEARRIGRTRPSADWSRGPAVRASPDVAQGRAQADGVPAYVVFHDATLAAIAEERPTSRAALAAITGVGPAKLERYADEILRVVTTETALTFTPGGRPASRPRAAGP